MTSKFSQPRKRANLPDPSPAPYTLPEDFDIDRAAASVRARIFAYPAAWAADKFRASDRLTEIDKGERR